jgi:hypothetical protein
MLKTIISGMNSDFNEKNRNAKVIGKMIIFLLSIFFFKLYYGYRLFVIILLYVARL